MPTPDQFTPVTRPHRPNQTIITPDHTPSPIITNNRYVIDDDDDDTTLESAPLQDDADDTTTERAHLQDDNDDDDDFLFPTMSAPAASPALTALLNRCVITQEVKTPTPIQVKTHRKDLANELTRIQGQRKTTTGLCLLIEDLPAYALRTGTTLTARPPLIEEPDEVPTNAPNFRARYMEFLRKEKSTPSRSTPN